MSAAQALGLSSDFTDTLAGGWIGSAAFGLELLHHDAMASTEVFHLMPTLWCSELNWCLQYLPAAHMDIKTNKNK